MTQTTYNGWTNYATWRIALEWFDDFNPNEHERDAYQFSKELSSYVEECLSLDCSNIMTLDYCFAFIADVNWYEIAEHLIAEGVENE